MRTPGLLCLLSLACCAPVTSEPADCDGGCEAVDADAGSGGKADGGLPKLGDCRLVGCPNRWAYCTSDWTLSRTKGTGTCDTDTGVCSFSWADESCEHPPRGECNGSALSWFVSPGTCVDDGAASRCDYERRTSTCADGCSGGACVGVSCVGAHACGNLCVSNISLDHCGPVNCGPCRAPDHATPVCASNSCGFTCNEGFHWCSERCQSCPAGSDGTDCANGACVARSCVAGQWLGNGRCYVPGPEVVLTTEPLAREPRVAVGPDGTVHVAWLNPMGVQYARVTGGQVSPRITVYSSSKFLTLVGLKLDQQGRPQVAFIEDLDSYTIPTRTLHLAGFDGSGFTTSAVLTSQFTGGAAFALGADGSQHVTVMQYPLAQVRYGSRAAGATAWTFTTVAATLGLPGGASIAFDAQGEVLLSWTETGAHEVHLARRSGGQWVDEKIPTQGQPQKTELQRAADGTVFLLAQSVVSDSEFSLLWRRGGQWHTAAVPDARSAGLALDPQSRPVLLAGYGYGAKMALITFQDGDDGSARWSFHYSGVPGGEIRLAPSPTGGFAGVYRDNGLRLLTLR